MEDSDGLSERALNRGDGVTSTEAGLPGSEVIIPDLIANGGPYSRELPGHPVILQVDRGLQGAAQLLEIEVQATRGPPRSAETQCLPLDSLPQDDRDELLQSYHLANSLQLIMPRLEAVLLQNAHLDVFEDELAALGEDEGPATAAGRPETTLSELQSFVDLSYSHGRAVTRLQWLPQRRGAFAAACTQAEPAPGRHGVLVWSFADLIHPDYVLETAVEVGTFAINPGQPHMVAGGCITGQVMLWDCSEAEAQVALLGAVKRAMTDAKRAPGAVPYQHLSSVEHSHRDPVTDLCWLPGAFLTREGSRPATAEESGRAGHSSAFFATAAADGRVLFWDMRVLRQRRPKRELDDGTVEWRPLYEIRLRSGLGTELPCACVSFCAPEHAAEDPSTGRMLLAASHDGEVATADYSRREASSAAQMGAEQQPTPRAEADKLAAAMMQQPAAAHCSSIVALQRSPFLDALVLTAGGWDWALWLVDDLGEPLMRSPVAPAIYTAAAWSPTRPGVLFAGRADGMLEAWDLLDRSHEPVLVTTASTAAVTSLAFSAPPPAAAAKGRSMQQLLAVGDGVGLVHIMDVPRSLKRRASTESKALGAMVQRELARIQWLAAHAASAQPPLLQATAPTEVVANPTTGRQQGNRKSQQALQEEEDRIEELDYQRMEAAYRIELGLASAYAL